jgi:hypothetical protein
MRKKTSVSGRSAESSAFISDLLYIDSTSAHPMIQEALLVPARGKRINPNIKTMRISLQIPVEEPCCQRCACAVQWNSVFLSVFLSAFS